MKHTIFDTYPKYMWILIANKKMQTKAKYKTEWMSIDNPLVWKLPNSTNLALPGIWTSKPGVKRMNNTTDTKTGPQSDIFSSFNGFWFVVFANMDEHGTYRSRKGKVGYFGTRDKKLMTRKWKRKKKAKVTNQAIPIHYSYFTTHTNTHATIPLQLHNNN